MEVEEKSILQLIDSMCYVDTDYDQKSIKKRVNRLVKEEMKKIPESDKREYLSHLEEPKEINFDPETHPFLHELQMRVKNDQMNTPMYDKSRYDNVKAKEMLECIQKLYIQSSYLSQKKVNLDLMKVNARDSWILFNSTLKDQIDKLKEMNEKIKEDINDLNRKRKYDQMRYGKKIDGLNNEYVSLLKDIDEVEGEVGRKSKRVKIMTDFNEYSKNVVLKSEGNE